MHRMTKFTQIPPSVKNAVFARDAQRCILCQSPYGLPNAHVVRRSQGGMGVEKNIVTLCDACHKAFDEGKDREALYAKIVAYLKGFYPDWTRDDVIYRKGAVR